MDHPIEKADGLTRDEWRAQLEKEPELSSLDIEHIIAVAFGDLPEGDVITLPKPEEEN